MPIGGVLLFLLTGLAGAQEQELLSARGLSAMELHEKTRPHLDLAPDTGVVVVHVDEGSPAAGAGLWAGDVILSIDQQPVATLDALAAALREGAAVSVEVHRKFDPRRWQELHPDKAPSEADRYGARRSTVRLEAWLSDVERQPAGTQSPCRACHFEGSVGDHTAHSEVDRKLMDSFSCPSGTTAFGGSAVAESWCEGEGGRHGPSLAFFANGRLYTTGSYAQGQREGEWIERFPSGGHRSVYHYDQGVLTGAFTEFDDNGVVRRQGEHRQGRARKVRCFDGYGVRTRCP